jgi:hypothetical protein
MNIDREAKPLSHAEMEEKLVSYLLEKILLSDQKNYTDYLHTAEFYGYSLNGPLRIANVEFVNLPQYAAKFKDRTSLLNCQIRSGTL